MQSRTIDQGDALRCMLERCVAYKSDCQEIELHSGLSAQSVQKVQQLVNESGARQTLKLGWRWAFLPFSVTCFFVYGRVFGSAFRLFAPLCGTAAIGAIGAPLIIVMNAKNKTWWSLGFGILKSLALVALTLWWVPVHLSMGLAWGFFVSEISFYLIATEFCIGVGVMPAGIRQTFYAACLGAGAIVLLAITLPDVGRWALALPASLLVAIWLVRGYPPLVGWLGESVPHALRPRAQSILNFISS